MCLPCDSGVSALVQRVYGNVQHCSDLEVLMERSILTPRNSDVEDINSYVLHRWGGQVCHAKLWLQQQALCCAMRCISNVVFGGCNMRWPRPLAACMHTELHHAVAACARASEPPLTRDVAGTQEHCYASADSVVDDDHAPLSDLSLWRC